LSRGRGRAQAESTVEMRKMNFKKFKKFKNINSLYRNQLESHIRCAIFFHVFPQFMLLLADGRFDFEIGLKVINICKRKTN
jgi:hypothetical protein